MGGCCAKKQFKYSVEKKNSQILSEKINLGHT